MGLEIHVGGGFIVIAAASVCIVRVVWVLFSKNNTINL